MADQAPLDPVDAVLEAKLGEIADKVADQVSDILDAMKVDDPAAVTEVEVNDAGGGHVEVALVRTTGTPDGDDYTFSRHTRTVEIGSTGNLAGQLVDLSQGDVG